MSSATSPRAVRAAEWAEALEEAGEDELVTLLTLRPDLCAAGAASLAELAEGVVHPVSLAMLHRRCSRPFRQILEACCLVRSPFAPAELSRLLGVEPAELDPFLDRLQAAFVLRRLRGGQLAVNPGLPAALPRPARLGPGLREVLAHQPSDTLRTVAGRLGLAAPRAKEPTLDLLIEHLVDPDFLAGVLKGGPEGTARLADLVAMQGPVAELQGPVEALTSDDRTPAGYLLRRGILLPTGWRQVVMAREVALARRGGRLFPDLRLEPPPVSLEPVAGDPDPSAAEAAQQIVADLAALAELWAENPGRLLQAGGLGVREVRRVAKALSRPEPDAARLVDLARLAELVSEDDDEETVLPTRRYDRWRAKDTAHRWADLAAAWLVAPTYLSLAGSPGEGGKPIPALLDWDIASSASPQRQVLLELLAQLPPGERPERASLVERLTFDQPDLWSEGPAEPAVLVGWLLDEAGRLGVTAEDRLSSFGRALLAEPDLRAAGPGRVSLALTKAAAALAEVLPPQVDHLVLQADLTALAPGELRPELRAEMELLADLESAGSATLWRFSPRSLERALQAGRSAEEILAFLEGHAPKGVPQPLAYLVADLGRRFGRLRVGPAGSILRSEDPSLLTELVAVRRLAHLNLRLIAPTVAVSQAAPEAVHAALSAAGYLAAAEDAAGGLVLRRSSSRRADASSPLDDEEEEEDEDLSDEEMEEVFGALLLEEPGLLAALSGLPEDLIASLRQRVERSGAVGVVEEPTAMARRLRAGPSGQGGRNRPATSPPAQAHRGTSATPPPGTASGQLRLVEDRGGRPSRIGRTPEEIATLLELACEEDWLVRLSCANGSGERREMDAQVLDLEERIVEVARLPRGDIQRIARKRIHWVRILTEAEEETRL